MPLTDPTGTRAGAKVARQWLGRTAVKVYQRAMDVVTFLLEGLRRSETVKDWTVSEAVDSLTTKAARVPFVV